MQPFPAVDPIPLPAPIWLFKLLHIVTLALHFVAVEMLLGGLLIAVVFSLFKGSPLHQTAARALASRMTVVMTYVINLGVPPLLFAQVLYGRALYTSSVLIGSYWISLILVLMLVYRFLYRFSKQLDEGKTAWPVGLAAWALAGFVARILSTNMTLMLRPEDWKQMYAASGAGVFLPHGDPTLVPRWLVMMAGGIFFGGLWLIYLSSRQAFSATSKRFLSSTGGWIAASSGVVYLAAGLAAFNAQPEPIKAILAYPPAGYGFYSYYLLGSYLWILLGIAAGLLKLTSGLVAWSGATLALLIEVALVTYRDALRDLTLLTKGYDVWNRAVESNWGVIVIFLVLFVGGLGVIGWLISVVARAKVQPDGLTAP